jgi:hypothetical protein
MGVHGAIAELDPGEGGVEVSCADARPDRHILEAVRDGAALRLVVERDTKLFAFEAPTDDRPPRSLLVRSRPVPLPVADGLAILGPDVAAIDMTARQDYLVDPVIGRSTARFMIRTGGQELLHLLGGAVSVPFDDLDDQVVAAIVEASPTHVVETAVGRIEVDGAIPPPDGRSSDGSHTHLRRVDLALGIDLEVFSNGSVADRLRRSRAA